MFDLTLAEYLIPALIFLPAMFLGTLSYLAYTVYGNYVAAKS